MGETTTTSSIENGTDKGHFDEGASSAAPEPAPPQRMSVNFGAVPARVAPRRGSDPSLTKDFHDRTLSAQGRRNRAIEMRKTGWVIDPRHSRIMAKWDITMLIALIFTALITPVEVSFLDEGAYVTPMFVVNRVVDLIFTTDLFLTFNVAYQENLDNGGHWVMNKRVLARHYLRGWFLLDFVSVLPFWTISLTWDDPFGRATVGSDGNPGALARTTVLFRVVKLLRMLRIARVFKASRVLQRVLLDFVMNQWEWTFAVLKMIKLFTILTTYAHWQACIWGFVSSYMHAEGYPNWISEFEAYYAGVHGDGESEGPMPSGLEVYAAALYWSVMTLTSIGYGEMTPINTAERVLCSVYMMASGVMWTYAIGSVAAIATTLDPNAILYQTTMDSLNYFMRERELPREMRMQLRDYFSSARRVMQYSDDGELLDKMSPLLQGTVALAANKKWLDHIWFFRGLEELEGGSDFIAGLAKSLMIRSFVGHERLPIGQLYILRRGLVVKMWRFLGTGKVWGEDMILDNPELIDHSQAVALTYVEAYTLRRNELDDLLDEYPAAAARVHSAARRVTMQRAMLRYLAIVQGKKGPRSVALRSQAKGFVEVHEQLSMEQKVAELYEVLVSDDPTGRKKEGMLSPFLQQKKKEEPLSAESFKGEASAVAAEASVPSHKTHRPSMSLRPVKQASSHASSPLVPPSDGCDLPTAHHTRILPDAETKVEDFAAVGVGQRIEAKLEALTGLVEQLMASQAALAARVDGLTAQAAPREES